MVTSPGKPSYHLRCLLRSLKCATQIVSIMENIAQMEWHEVAHFGTKNDILALAIAKGHSVADAAAEAGIGRRTAFRWLADPTFKARIQVLRGEMVAQALGRLADGMNEAADGLRALCKAESESVRLGACRTMLELSLKLRECLETEDRLAALEARLSEVY